MRATNRAGLLIAIAASGALLSACTQASPLALVVFGAGLVLVPFSFRARAGAPLPCSGWEIAGCVDGRIQKACCPQGAICNFQSRPFVACGADLCTERDRGYCPDPVAKSDPGQDCGDAWEPACIEGRVKRVCISLMPTNYSGPPLNPSFTTCGVLPGLPTGTEAYPGTACTTNILPERCYPAKDDTKTVKQAHAIAAKACGVLPWGNPTSPAKWTEVCLDGRVVERCLPTTNADKPFEATSFLVIDKKTKACVLRAP